VKYKKNNDKYFPVRNQNNDSNDSTILIKKRGKKGKKDNDKTKKIFFFFFKIKERLRGCGFFNNIFITAGEKTAPASNPLSYIGVSVPMSRFKNNINAEYEKNKKKYIYFRNPLNIRENSKTKINSKKLEVKKKKDSPEFFYLGKNLLFQQNYSLILMVFVDGELSEAINKIIEFNEETVKNK